MSKVTGWINGSLKPVRIGVYERKSNDGGYTSYSMWNGMFWCAYTITPVGAAMLSNSNKSAWQSWQWRGLTEESK